MLVVLFISSTAYTLGNNFVDNGDGTVTDNSTRLTWQKATAPGMYDFYDADTYCEKLELGDYTDWYLPSKYQLSTLLDTSFSPTINTQYFPDTEADGYWSSNEYYYSGDWGDLPTPDRAYLVDFDEGRDDYTNLRTTRYYVRAVREDCFATYILSMLSPKLHVLRKFRDKKLLPSSFGRKMVRFYYEISPYLIEICEKNSVVKWGFKNMLEGMIPTVERIL